MNTIFIGIAGGTGSGKTTLTEHLAARFGSDISVVHHDNYYKRQDRPFAERCLQNYDHPDAFDTDLMIEDLTTVKPMHEQFVEPTRKFADIIVLEGGHNLVALDMIMQRIAGHIKEN